MSTSFTKTFCTNTHTTTGIPPAAEMQILQSLLRASASPSSISIGSNARLPEATQRLGESWHGTHVIKFESGSPSLCRLFTQLQQSGTDEQGLKKALRSFKALIVRGWNFRPESTWAGAEVSFDWDDSVVDVRKYPDGGGYALSLVFSRTDQWAETDDDPRDPYKAIQVLGMIPSGGEISMSGDEIAFPSFTCELWGVPRVKTVSGAD